VRLTILRDRSSPAQAPDVLALATLGWVLQDEGRADRFLAVTGLTPDELRAGLGDPATQAAVLDFLCAHEPDLIAAAEAIGVEPAELARAAETLSR
jgi:hypothetical protein